jgi:hypothetical protein
LRPAPGKWFLRPQYQITRAKWSGGADQAGECLLGKHEALNSSPSPTKIAKTKTFKKIKSLRNPGKNKSVSEININIIINFINEKNVVSRNSHQKVDC